MGKTLACKDVGVACDFVIHGKDENDVLRQAAAHAQGMHKDIQMTPEVQAKVRSAIKDEGHAHGSSGSGCCGGSSGGGGSCG